MTYLQQRSEEDQHPDILVKNLLGRIDETCGAITNDGKHGRARRVPAARLG